MSLKRYKEKRHFEQTPEPVPASGRRTGPLRFVVQKHSASHLHFDFRLEMDGVLKSWAIPKGPSMDPHEKRLAIMVEDHPLEYGSFEGIIPEGNYGAGTVEIWDEGTYNPENILSRTKAETILREELEKGAMKFELHGEKLKGIFNLVKMKGRDDDAWLLIKHHDSYE